jgi:hypothetical protein
MRLESIRIYPVKSGGELRLERADVEPAGLRSDRRWMVVEPDGRFVTRRQEPALAGLGVADAGDAWELRHGDGEGCILPKSWADGRPMDVEIWGQRVRALEARGDVSAWLSERLGRALTLVFVPEADLRPVEPEFARPGDVVGFADAYPALLVNASSVQALAREVGRPLDDGRFRPNLVMSGAEAFAEDGWASVRIGGVTFDVAKPCARCRVIDQDPGTGKPDGGVLRALGTFRRSGRNVLFGENLVPRSAGEVRVGDAVEVLARRAEASVIRDA